MEKSAGISVAEDDGKRNNKVVAVSIIAILLLLGALVWILSTGGAKEQVSPRPQLATVPASTVKEVDESELKKLENRLVSLEENDRPRCVPAKKHAIKKARKHLPPPQKQMVLQKADPAPEQPKAIVAQPQPQPQPASLKVGAECGDSERKGTYQMINGQIACLLDGIVRNPVRIAEPYYCPEPEVVYVQPRQVIYEELPPQEDAYYEESRQDSSWLPWVIGAGALAWGLNRHNSPATVVAQTSRPAVVTGPVGPGVTTGPAGPGVTTGGAW